MMSLAYQETLKSPSDASSRSVSPVVVRPTATAMPHQKQRSSSMNSVGSAHSIHQRSMSIVSSESPRNSIVSVDDFFVKPTRNNSSSSLASLGVSGSPLDPPKDANLLQNRFTRPKTRSACALTSDEESSEPEHASARSSAWRRRRSSDKVHKPEFLLSFKNNFKFKCDSYVKPKAPSNLLAPTGSAAKHEEQMPSPLSAAIEGPHQQHLSLFNTPETESLPPAARPPVTPTAKKSRSSSMTQSMFLKRKLLLSKDIQFELLSSNTSTTASFPGHNNNEGHESRSPSHFLSQTPPHKNTSPGLPSHFSGEVSPSPMSQAYTAKAILAYQQGPNTPSLPQGAPLPNGYSSTYSISSPPTEQTLRQQNKLITELNRKWNRAMYSPSLDDYVSQDASSLDFIAGRMKKRGRSESSSSTDSLATNY